MDPWWNKRSVKMTDTPSERLEASLRIEQGRGESARVESCAKRKGDWGIAVLGGGAIDIRITTAQRENSLGSRCGGEITPVLIVRSIVIIERATRNEKRSACTREAKCSHRARSPALYVITQPREGSFYRPPLRVYSTTPSLPPTRLLYPSLESSDSLFFMRRGFRASGERTLTTSPNTFERRNDADRLNSRQRTAPPAAPLNFIMYSTTVSDRSHDIASRIFLYFPSSVALSKQRKRKEGEKEKENGLVTR